jgi:hypothetical protein
MKVKITIGYADYELPADLALRFLQEARQVRTEHTKGYGDRALYYHPAEISIHTFTGEHIFPDQATAQASLGLIPPASTSDTLVIEEKSAEPSPAPEDPLQAIVHAHTHEDPLP